MPRCNIREENPAKYAQVKAEQEKLRAECSQSSSITLARLCPYCGHKIEILSRGTHGYAFTKCHEQAKWRGECRIPASIISFSMKPLK